MLGWSPVIRKMLRGKNRISHRPSHIDEAEDGGRAQVIEEALVAAIYTYGVDHNFLRGISKIDHSLLIHIQKMVKNLEVSSKTLWEWNNCIVTSFGVWRDLVENDGGVVKGKHDRWQLDIPSPLMYHECHEYTR